MSDSDSLTVTLESTDKDDLRGLFVAKLGTGTFTGVRNSTNTSSFKGPYTYELRISFNLDYVPPITIQMNIRECRISAMDRRKTKVFFAKSVMQHSVADGNYWHLSRYYFPPQKFLTTYACVEAVAIEEKVQKEEYRNIKDALGNYCCKVSEAARRILKALMQRGVFQNLRGH